MTRRHFIRGRQVTEAEYHAARGAPPGLGDVVAAVATPIARVLRLPCIDPATKQLRPESRCAQRRQALNDLTRRLTQ